MITSEALKTFASSVLGAAGAAEEEAEVLAEILTCCAAVGRPWADLVEARGHLQRDFLDH